MKSVKSYRIATDAMLASLALMLTFVESVIPIQAIVPIPGFRLGLSNIAVMAAVYFSGRADGVAVALVKVIISSVLFSNPTSFFYSLAGTLLSVISLIILATLSKDIFSFIGISVICALFHNVGQIAVSMLIFGKSAFSIFPYLMLVSLFSGIVTGTLVITLTKPLEKIFSEMGKKE